MDPVVGLQDTSPQIVYIHKERRNTIILKITSFSDELAGYPGKSPSRENMNGRYITLLGALAFAFFFRRLAVQDG